MAGTHHAPSPAAGRKDDSAAEPANPTKPSLVPTASDNHPNTRRRRPNAPQHQNPTAPHGAATNNPRLTRPAPSKMPFCACPVTTAASSGLARARSSVTPQAPGEPRKFHPVQEAIEGPFHRPSITTAGLDRLGCTPPNPRTGANLVTGSRQGVAGPPRLYGHLAPLELAHRRPRFA